MSRLAHETHEDARPLRYAAIYCRVSTEDQGKGFSIPTQIEACHTLAAPEGYSASDAHVFVDEGISGTTMDRPSLRKLRDFVATQAISAIIGYDPDRLSRNLGHQLLLAEECDRAAVELLIVSHPLERGPEGWLFFQMRGALAEYERAKLLERTHRGRVGRVKAGYPGGGSVPFGYRRVREPHKGHLEIDDETAPIARRIFQMYATGATLWAIAKQLTGERVPTKFDREGSFKQRQQKRLGYGRGASPSCSACYGMPLMPDVPIGTSGLPLPVPLGASGHRRNGSRLQYQRSSRRHCSSRCNSASNSVRSQPSQSEARLPLKWSAVLVWAMWSGDDWLLREGQKHPLLQVFLTLCDGEWGHVVPRVHSRR
jgi:DNA invertase Pin-like site-specific DNA recombinase